MNPIFPPSALGSKGGPHDQTFEHRPNTPLNSGDNYCRTVGFPTWQPVCQTGAKEVASRQLKARRKVRTGFIAPHSPIESRRTIRPVSAQTTISKLLTRTLDTYVDTNEERVTDENL